MPSSSKKQHNFMEAVAHSPTFAKKVGVPQSVGKDFSAADKGRRFAPGGAIPAQPTPPPPVQATPAQPKPRTMSLNDANKFLEKYNEFEYNAGDYESNSAWQKAKDAKDQIDAINKLSEGYKTGRGINAVYSDPRYNKFADPLGAAQAELKKQLATFQTQLDSANADMAKDTKYQSILKKRAALQPIYKQAFAVAQAADPTQQAAWEAANKMKSTIEATPDEGWIYRSDDFVKNMVGKPIKPVQAGLTGTHWQRPGAYSGGVDERKLKGSPYVDAAGNIRKMAYNGNVAYIPEAWGDDPNEIIKRLQDQNTKAARTVKTGTRTLSKEGIGNINQIFYQAGGKVKKVKRFNGMGGSSVSDDSNYANENEANVPDWVLEDSARSLREARAEKAKQKRLDKKAADDWGKDQVLGTQRARERLFGKDKDLAVAQELYPDQPIPDRLLNKVGIGKDIEEDLKFNPGSKDEMTAKEARDNAYDSVKNKRKRLVDYINYTEANDKTKTGYKKGGNVKKSNDKKWIGKAIKKPGALRQSLGVKAGEKIPAKKLAEAAKKPGKTGQRARLAQTLKGFKEGGHVRGGGCESRGKTRGKYV